MRLAAFLVMRMPENENAQTFQGLGVELVEPGGIEPPSASPLQADLHT